MWCDRVFLTELRYVLLADHLLQFHIRGAVGSDAMVASFYRAQGLGFTKKSRTDSRFRQYETNF